MARRYVTVSDLSGKEIGDGEKAAVRVLTHPAITSPVQIDAGALEVASLKGKDDLVEIELLLPNTPPERLVVDRAVFDKLFKDGSPADVLGSAASYEPDESTVPRRRGRPAGSKNVVKTPGTGMSKEQLQNVRQWLRANGEQVSERGRIAGPLMKKYEDAHASS